MINALSKSSQWVTSKELKEKIRWFSRQEAQHALAHREFWEVMSREGFKIKHFQNICRFVGEKLLPRLPRKLIYAIIAAIEHNTAVLGTIVLEENALQRMEPEARDLLEWHCREELEHREVAFDVLQEISGSSLLLRYLGLTLAILILSLLASWGTLYFLMQDRVRWSRVPIDLLNVFIFQEGLLSRGFLRGWKYLQPGFHPASL